jgi:hypothetical protein
MIVLSARLPTVFSDSFFTVSLNVIEFFARDLRGFFTVCGDESVSLSFSLLRGHLSLLSTGLLL